jgi:parallel beta-helix repeat protein
MARAGARAGFVSERRPHRARRAARALATAGFATLLLSAAAIGAHGGTHGRGAGFPRHYPKDPLSFERPNVTGAAPRASRSTTVKGPIEIRSLAELAALLPAGTLREVGSRTWRLREPIDVTRGATLAIDRTSLEIGPGAFLQARAGGSILFTNSTIAAVGADGSAADQPTPGRGFLVARDGGRLDLRRDTVKNLGHLATVAYGISFRDPGAGSSIVDSTIEGNYFGVFLSGARGVAIVGNRVLDSYVYAIDPYGYSTDLLIARNYIARSGLHGIVLADHVSRTRVIDNQIVDVRAHGIVLFDHSTANLIRGNRVSRAFDGIVVTNASSNSLVGNIVDRVTRFGLRISNGSMSNRFSRNAVSHALLGAYLYGGATGNMLLETTFSNNRENVRVRFDAPLNEVRPKPALSELR